MGNNVASDRGHVIVLSGPSGSGKNSIISRIMKIIPSLTYIPSYTTRKIRDGEENGVNYHFTDDDKFNEMLENGEFIEFETVHGKLYGTSAKLYEEAVNSGINVIKDIDVNGALELRQRFEKSVLIYITPSDTGVLIDRLIQRGESTNEISTRMERIKYEESMEGEFDYTVINDNIEEAVAMVEFIIRHELGV